MIALILAIVAVLLGVLPLFLAKRTTAGSVLGVIGYWALWFGYYGAMPSLVWPLGGAVGGAVVVLWIIAAVIEFAGNYDSYGRKSMGDVKRLPIAFAVLGIVGFLGYTVLSSWGAFRAHDYARLIGEVEKREWTQDVQPKDPRHVRLVPEELAFYLATKQLGEAAGAVGSQFEVSKNHMTLQMIKGELWYVVPLDFKSFSTWQTAKVSPGFVMVHGEDPKHPVTVKTGERFAYMPGAYFGSNLERHIWASNLATGITDYSFEIDEQGKAWWVVTTFKPTIGFGGEIVTGVITVDPGTGETVVYPKDKTPAFIERVTPREYMWSTTWT
ncbi:MAG: hypothetical protein UX89_C0007G0034 [Parcubacteria group bacterium GW2011_GWA2_47_16]|nr:MAG: hypothetical protein UX89_C0007G0034 [Parcubacteria group bacterium GW2011_GWA2_47_16]